MPDLEILAKKTIDFGAAAAGIVNSAEIKFSGEFRSYCEQNQCGKFGTNWMCPPAVESFEEVKAKVLGYKAGVVFQTVHSLEDSFDYEGMANGKEAHLLTFKQILKHIHSGAGNQDFLALNAGECTICEQCTYPDEACRFPDQAVSSIEAYCIDVYDLLSSCNIPYNNGPNTVFYAGLFLF